MLKLESVQAQTKALAVAGPEAGPCILGIDEAGRGPVLGPMVYAAAFCAESDEAELATMSFADSKTLKEEQRETLFAEIAGDNRLGYAVEAVSAADISCRMLQRERISLNAIANECTFALITAVQQMGYTLSKVFVDTVGDADRHRERLEQRFPGISFTVCPKADAIYPIVSAASIVAKVTRDVSLREYAFRERDLMPSREFGSGYPSDPVTKAWLEAAFHPLFGFPEITRFSWQPIGRALEEKGPKTMWPCDCEEEVQQITGFMNGSKDSGNTAKTASSGIGRPAFFRSRKLARLTNAF